MAEKKMTKKEWKKEQDVESFDAQIKMVEDRIKELQARKKKLVAQKDAL